MDHALIVKETIEVFNSWVHSRIRDGENWDDVWFYNTCPKAFYMTDEQRLLNIRLETTEHRVFLLSTDLVMGGIYIQFTKLGVFPYFDKQTSYQIGLCPSVVADCFLHPNRLTLETPSAPAEQERAPLLTKKDA